MYANAAQIVARANKLVRGCGTRRARRLAAALDIEILPRHFKRQRGAYKIILRNPFIFLKADLDPVMEEIILLHEIGHHCLHRDEAERRGGFQEFNIFDMRNNRMEYEANVFASQIALPDEDILEQIERGYDVQQIAAAMRSDINLVALKIDTLISQGYRLRRQDHDSRFLQYRK